MPQFDQTTVSERLSGDLIPPFFVELVVRLLSLVIEDHSIALIQLKST